LAWQLLFVTFMTFSSLCARECARETNGFLGPKLHQSAAAGGTRAADSDHANNVLLEQDHVLLQHLCVFSELFAFFYDARKPRVHHAGVVLAGFQPAVQLIGKGDNGAAVFAPWTANWKAKIAFPTLRGSYPAPQVSGNFFPGIEKLCHIF